MTVTVHVTFSEKPTDEWDAALGEWLASYIDAGNTGPFPAPSTQVGTGGDVYREWDTEENANKYIAYLLAFSPAPVESAVIE